MVWLPCKNDETVHAALPAATATAAHPAMSSVPSLNATEPVGAGPEPTMLAVSVIDSLTLEGFFDDARLTVGVATEATVKVYDAMVPRDGLLCCPVSMPAMWPSTANAWTVCDPAASPVNDAV